MSFVGESEGDVIPKKTDVKTQPADNGRLKQPPFEPEFAFNLISDASPRHASPIRFEKAFWEAAHRVKNERGFADLDAAVAPGLI